MFEQIRKI